MRILTCFLSFPPKTISDQHVFTATSEKLGFIECRKSNTSDLRMLIYFCKREGEQKNQLTTTNRIRYYLKGKQVSKKEAYPICSATRTTSGKTNKPLHSERLIEPYFFFPPLPPLTQKEQPKKEKKRKSRN